MFLINSCLGLKVALDTANGAAAVSARNLANVTVATPATASVLDIVNADKLLVTKEVYQKHRSLQNRKMKYRG